MRIFFVFLIFLIVCAKALGQTSTPKNIIIMIADGGGYNQMMCTDYYLYGKYPAPSLVDFPVQLSMSTYNGDTKNGGATCYNSEEFWDNFNCGISGFTESAAAATAMATGFKTHNDMVGMNLDNNPTTNIIEIAKSVGKKTGVVTSVQFAHATPAGFSAHATSRKFMHEIGAQMIFNKNLDVIGGSGHPWFDDDGNKTSLPNLKDTDTLLYNYLKNSTEWSFVENRNGIKQFANKEKIANKLFMLAPVGSTLAEKRSGDSKKPFDIAINANIPTLAEMSIAALNTLNATDKGFLLMIEGGAIDWANHDNLLPRLIEEQTAFYNAVDSVLAWLNKNNVSDETLIICTNDHECGYLWGADYKPFSLPENKGLGNLPTAKYFSKNHSNSLVPFFAKGASSDIFYTFADETDCVYGQFLTNTEIAIAIKCFWGNTAKIFSKNPMGKEKTLMVSLPCPNAKIQWIANGEIIKNATKTQFIVDKNVYKKPTKFECKLICGEKTYLTKEYEYIP